MNTVEGIFKFKVVYTDFFGSYSNSVQDSCCFAQLDYCRVLSVVLNRIQKEKQRWQKWQVEPYANRDRHKIYSWHIMFTVHISIWKAKSTNTIITLQALLLHINASECSVRRMLQAVLPNQFVLNGMFLMNINCLKMRGELTIKYNFSICFFSLRNVLNFHRA